MAGVDKIGFGGGRKFYREEVAQKGWFVNMLGGSWKGRGLRMAGVAGLAAGNELNKIRGLNQQRPYVFGSSWHSLICV